MSSSIDVLTNQPVVIDNVGNTSIACVVSPVAYLCMCRAQELLKQVSLGLSTQNVTSLHGM